MKIKKLTLALLTSLWLTQADAAELPYNSMVKANAYRTGIPAEIIHGVIKTESSYRPDIVSPKGAVGLMQLMPGTAKRFNVRNSRDPAQNIRGGTDYLAWLYNRYRDWNLTLAAYNAGEGAVDKYQGIPPYKETINYVKKVALYIKNIQPSTLPIENRITTVKANEIKKASQIMHKPRPYHSVDPLLKLAMEADTHISWQPPLGY